LVSSSWRITWHDDFDRVLYSMSPIERTALHQSGLLSVDGRRLFVSAAGRLDMDVVHTAYVMEQATLE
jgi:hypothetical protein